MKIKIDGLLIFLVISVFGDILRIPKTSIAFFRVVLPIVFIYCLGYVENRIKIIISTVAFFMLYLIQSLFYKMVFPQYAKVDIVNFITYSSYFISIYVIFLVVKVIRVKKKEEFEIYFLRLLTRIGYVYVLMFFLSLSNLNCLLSFANRNTYATGIAAIFPLYFLNANKGKHLSMITCVLSIVGLYIGDCKAALIGIILQIILFIFISVMKKVKYSNKFFILFSFVFIYLGYLLLMNNISINSYRIGDMFYEMKQHILHFELFSTVQSSINFRTNSIIYCLKLLFDSKLIGIGIGNTTIYLAECMREILPVALKNSKAISVHYGLLEFYCDCGLLGIALTLVPFYCAIKKLINTKENSYFDDAFMLFTLSFPLWCMSASGIYTIMLLYLIIAFFYEIHLKHKSEIMYRM